MRSNTAIARALSAPPRPRVEWRRHHCMTTHTATANGRRPRMLAHRRRRPASGSNGSSAALNPPALRLDFANGAYTNAAGYIRTNYFLNAAAPVTQTISLGTGTYTLNVTGTGSGTVAAGTATITGAGAATAGAWKTFTVTGAGTVTVTIAGSVTTAQLEPSNYPSSFINTAGAAVTVTTYSSTNLADVGNLTYTRAGTAYASDASGNLISFAANVPRIVPGLGYLAEPASTNSIQNSTMVGATASSLPTGWSFQAATGLTQSVVGIGTEFGRNYIDWSIVGTTAIVTNPALFFQPGGTDGVAASSGQNWTPSFYYRLVSGVIPGATGISNFVNSFIAVGTYLSTPIVSVGSTSTGFNRQQVSGVLPATTAFIQEGVGLLGLPAGTYNLVLRIYQPQLERGSNATSDILTTTTAVTRPADVGYFTGSFPGPAGTLAATWIDNKASGLAGVASVNDGTSANKVDIRSNSLVATPYLTVAGVNMFGATVGSAGALGASHSAAISWAASMVRASSNGSAILSSTPTATPPTLARLNLGDIDGGGVAALNGYLSKVALWTSAANDSETQYRAAGNF